MRTTNMPAEFHMSL
ncbi:hypothetical protein LEMLEM_LOCUS847 [Lemmus lemmus]